MAVSISAPASNPSRHGIWQGTSVAPSAAKMQPPRSSSKARLGRLLMPPSASSFFHATRRNTRWIYRPCRSRSLLCGRKSHSDCARKIFQRALRAGNSMPSKFRVFATADIGPSLDLLRKRGYEVEVYSDPKAPPKTLIIDKVKSGIDGLITTLRDPIDAEVFEAGKGRLKV